MQRAFADAGLVRVIGEHHFFPTVRAAVEATRVQHDEA
jgi:hypothetical protein